ncbi:MAG: VWA domain-containing protein [Saprospiraceae bacterium]|nr:VWA domain-containing protein [Candidatus Vicinibacter affinis]
MRRLPIYFLIDVSESMVGEQIQEVEEGLAAIIKELKTDPRAIETVWVSIIVFAGQARTIVPLQELINFYPPKFPIGSGTSLSIGLGHLMFELSKNIIKTTAEVKGDWKPIVFLFTDGVPTDNTQNAINEWKTNWGRTANLVAISFGDEADTDILNQLTNDVILFKNADSNAYKQFFKWVTDSIKTSSESIESKKSGFELAELDNNTLSKIDLSKNNKNKNPDPNFVVLSAKCQNTKRPYLMKYKHFVYIDNNGDVNRDYRLVGAFQVDNSYFELSPENSNQNNSIHTDLLRGAPTCPCCGNQFAFAACQCGNLHCIGNEEISTCPWCNNQGEYGFGDKGFNINRTQG